MKLDELFPVTPAVPRPARGRPSRLTIRRIPKAGRSCPRSPNPQASLVSGGHFAFHALRPTVGKGIRVNLLVKVPPF